MVRTDITLRIAQVTVTQSILSVTANSPVGTGFVIAAEAGARRCGNARPYPGT